MNRYINFKYEFDNSENHFCDDIDYCLNNKSFIDLIKNDKPSLVNKLSKINKIKV